MVKKIVAYILLFAMIVSLTVVPVSASGSFGSTITDSSAVTALDNYLERQFIVNISLIDFVSAAWNVIDRCFSAAGLDNVHSLDALHAVATRWNQQMNVKSNWPNLLSYIVTSGFDDVPVARVVFDSNFGVYRLQEKYSGLWLTNSAGHFPYYRPESSGGDSGSAPDPELKYRTGQWLDSRQFNESSERWHVSSYYELEVYRDQWIDVMDCRIFETEEFHWLIAYSGGFNLVLCDEYGHPFYCPKEGKTAISTPNNYYNETTNQFTDNDTTNNYYDYETNNNITNDNSTNVNVVNGGSALLDSLIDINSGTLNFGGNEQYIDSIIYDNSTHSYYVNAHDEYTYNIENNEYTTNYNLYRYEYNIYYTSVTYIGTTEEYNECYQYYYQLPDGRSSADLTAEDLEQLSIVFADVTGYTRTADSLDMRALYHFDGNTDDSSYWSYSTAFDWKTGASMTYMDEAEFGGSLYLSEVEHEFTITLPKAYDLNGDFTLQFRYYQSHTEAPSNDTTFCLGDYAWLTLDGAYYYLPNGNKLAATSVGEWNELCIMRSGDNLYWFVNGVLLYSLLNPSCFSPVLRFYFGSDQQTYKKLDELRFTRAAVYTAGSDYTPTAVPFDSNLSLILPDGEYIVADEFLNLKKGYNCLGSSMADWTSGVPSGVVAMDQSAFVTTLGDLAFDVPMFIYNPDYTTLVNGDGCGSFRSSTTEYLGEDKTYASHTSQWLTGGGLFFPIQSYRTSFGDVTSSWFVGDQFFDYHVWQLSLAFSDGTYALIPFMWNSSLDQWSFYPQYAVLHPKVSFERVEFKSRRYVEGDYFNVDEVNCVSGILLCVDPSVEIVHVNFCSSQGSRFSWEYESVYATSGQLEESPVLAVRSNYEITGYQIGGVRPSYPTKGLVYAMVENSRIVSLQQYTGSAWIEVDGRIWTGSRWIPYSSFDVFTLQDFYDVSGTSGDDYEYIYTESGFWSWFQKQWKKFMDKMDELIRAVKNSGGDVNVSIEDNTLIDDSDKEPLNPDNYKGIVKVIRRSVTFIFSSFGDFITFGMNGFFDAFESGESVFFGLFRLDGLG